MENNESTFESIRHHIPLKSNFEVNSVNIHICSYMYVYINTYIIYQELSIYIYIYIPWNLSGIKLSTPIRIGVQDTFTMVSEHMEGVLKGGTPKKTWMVYERSIRTLESTDPIALTMPKICGSAHLRLKKCVQFFLCSSGFSS